MAAIASSAAVKLANAAPEDGGGAPSGVGAGVELVLSHTLGPLQQRQSGTFSLENFPEREETGRELCSTYEWPCQAESSEPHGT